MTAFNRSLIVFPTHYDPAIPETVSGLTDSGEAVTVTLDPAHYHGAKEKPSLFRLFDPSRAGAATAYPSNGPEQYQQEPGLASALLFDRVQQKAGFSSHFVSGWASTLIAGAQRHLSGAYLEQAVQRTSPYSLGLGHIHYAIGQSQLIDQIGFVEMPYVVSNHLDKPFGEEPEHLRAIIADYRRHLTVLKKQAQLIGKSDRFAAIDASMNSAGSWADFVTLMASADLVQPKVRCYFPEQAISLKTSVKKCRDQFVEAARTFSTDGAYGGLYFRLKNIQTNTVLPSHSCVLMNTYDRDHQKPHDPAYQFDCFMQYLGGGKLMSETGKSASLSLDLIPIQEQAIARLAKADYLSPEKIRSVIVQNHAAIPVGGYNARLAVLACANTRVTDNSSMVKKINAISPELSALADLPVGEDGLNGSLSTIQMVDALIERSKTTQRIDIKNDFSSERVPRARVSMT